MGSQASIRPSSKEMKDRPNLGWNCMMFHTVWVSGHFDPLTLGHINYFKEAYKYSIPNVFNQCQVIAIINNDEQVKRKTGLPPFYSQNERLDIISSLKWISYAIIAIDEDNTVCKTLEQYAKKGNIFFNGGDVTKPEQVREKEVCDRLGVKLAFGSPAKTASSTAIKRRFLDGCYTPIRICEEDVGHTLQVLTV